MTTTLVVLALILGLGIARDHLRGDDPSTLGFAGTLALVGGLLVVLVGLLPGGKPAMVISGGALAVACVVILVKVVGSKPNAPR